GFAATDPGGPGSAGGACGQLSLLCAAVVIPATGLGLVLHIAVGALRLAGNLAGATLDLMLAAARGGTCLPLQLARDFLGCALYLMLVHGDPPSDAHGNREFGHW